MAEQEDGPGLNCERAEEVPVARPELASQDCKVAIDNYRLQIIERSNYLEDRIQKLNALVSASAGRLVAELEEQFTCPL